MNIKDSINLSTEKLDNWFKNQIPENQIKLSDSLSHIKEEVLNNDKYDENNTIDDLLKNLSRFLEKSKLYPDMAREARIYLTKNLKSIIEDVKSEPLKRQIKISLDSVRDFIISQDNSNDYEQAYLKLDKLFNLISGLKQRNVNLADMMLSQYKYQSLGLSQEERDIFNKTYKVVLEVIDRDQIAGQKDAIIKSYTKTKDSIPENKSASFTLGLERVLMDIINYKGNEVPLLIKTLSKEVELNKFSKESQDEIEFHDGQLHALKVFSEHYSPPKQAKFMKRDETLEMSN